VAEQPHIVTARAPLGVATVGVEATRPDATAASLGGPIYAVNWFDYKRAWSYETYNRLAGPAVVRVGGRLHFKGVVTEHLAGHRVELRAALVAEVTGGDPRDLAVLRRDHELLARG